MKRAENGKKPFESLDKKEYAFDEETGEEIELKKTKHIKGKHYRTGMRSVP